MTAKQPSEGRPASFTLADAAVLVDGRLEGDASTPVLGVRPVDEAEAEDLAFLAAKRYVKHAAEGRGGSYLVSEELEASVPEGRPYVVVGEPYVALQKLLSHFHPPTPVEPGVHPTAVLGSDVVLGDGVAIGPYAVLEDQVCVGDGVAIGAHVVIGRGCSVGPGTVVHPHVTLYPGTEVGARVIIHAGARLGSDGFGYVHDGEAHRKIPQVGRCIVGDDVEIGANTCLDRGSLGDTVVGDGVKLDNLVQVAHNVRVGAQSLMAALSGVAGSTRMGRRVWIGGQVGVVNHLEIGDGAQVAFGSILYKDLAEGETVSGHPARPHREELRSRAHLARLPKVVERVKELEGAVAALRKALEESR